MSASTSAPMRFALWPMVITYLSTFPGRGATRSGAPQTRDRFKYIAWNDPGSASPSGMTAARSLDRQRIDRRTDRAGDGDRRRDEHEFIHLVGGAIVCEFLEVEYLAHGHAHDRDR